MASVEKDRQGYRVRFSDHNGKRRAVRLGGINKANCQKIARYIEDIVMAKNAGLSLDASTAGWIGKLGDDLHSRLSAFGLFEPRRSSALKVFLENCINEMSGLKSGTITNLEDCKWNLIAFFGAEKPLRQIESKDARAFRKWLLDDEQLAENTMRRRCGRARQFFRVAVKTKLIDENPFEGMAVTVTGNKDKERFVTETESQRILDACPNAEWRLIYSLCRYGGLRCPSEVITLTWEDVVWNSSRIVVNSPKTEHIEGHESRVIPLFPELLQPLMDVRESAAPGSPYVITQYRSSNQNLRTELNRIVRRAGIIPWVKPFQNLRSTRETELMETYPAHVVCAWIGNSEAVARAHYLQVKDANFNTAAGGGAQAGAQHVRTSKIEDA